MIGLSLGLSAVVGTPVVSSALSITSASNDYRPTFLYNPGGSQFGDGVELQIDTTSAFSSPGTSQSLGPIVSNPPQFRINEALTPGSWFARARLIVGGTPQAWSVTLPFTIITYVYQLRVDSQQKIDAPGLRIDL